MEYCSPCSYEKQPKSRKLYFYMKNNVIFLCNTVFLINGLHQEGNC